MAKWIADGSIFLREIEGTRTEPHSAVSGNPQFNVRLEVPVNQLKNALAILLGLPETWPHQTQFEDVRCITAQVVANTGSNTTDSDKQLLYPENPTLIDCTYVPRMGKYVILDNGEDAYFDDVLKPRTETIPQNNRSFIWGNTTNTVPNDKAKTLTPNQAPVKFEPGDTLIHTVEGWTSRTTNLGVWVGTTNDTTYLSPVVHREFDPGELLLKHVEVGRSYSFRSYRLPFGSPVLPLMEMSGKATPLLQFVYEWRPKGWEKFYRIDADSITYPADYYYIRYANDPWDQYEPFPQADHQPWLGYL